MRRERIKNLSLDEPQMDVSSLVDVSFLLLIFFLVTATMIQKENDLALRLPGPVGGHSVPSSMVRVTIAKNGEISIGHLSEPEIISSSLDDHELSLLTKRIQLIQSVTDYRTPFQLKVSDAASHQRFTDVLNCFAKSGVDRIQILDKPIL